MNKSHTHWISLWTGVLLLGTILPSLAEVPRKSTVGRYTELWTKSPFTVPKPKDVPGAKEENPLDDYTLAGACEMKGGWFVVLINKKERDKRVRIRPGAENDFGFKVVKVENGGGYMDTKVQIQTRNGQRGTVEYDKKFIVLKKATPKAPVKPTVKPGQRPTRPGQPPVPTRTSRTPTPKPSTSGRSPRVRRIPNPPSR